jgi:acetoacetyl-CoA synthetase
VASITGGTDIISLFGAPNPWGPVRAGEVQCIGLGMAVGAVNSDGHQDVPVGVPGDLVCKKPFPCMPIYFLNDMESGEKYRNAYFARIPHMWHHGDFVVITRSGGMVMLGRSDGTLNPSGVRFGSAELYNIFGQFTEDIEDSLVVGVRRPGETDERVFAFLKMIPKRQLDDALVAKLKSTIRTSLSPRHIPAVIMETPTIPYTLNGKKVEVTVKRILSSGDKGSSVEANLTDPTALDFYRKLSENLP